MAITWERQPLGAFEITGEGLQRPERARLRRQVKALSAEGRLSAYVLLALPIGMALYMFAVRRAYIGRFRRRLRCNGSGRTVHHSSARTRPGRNSQDRYYAAIAARPTAKVRLRFRIWRGSQAFDRGSLSGRSVLVNQREGAGGPTLPLAGVGTSAVLVAGLAHSVFEVTASSAPERRP